MNTSDFLQTTKQYYANRLSVPVSQLNKMGIYCCYAPTRDKEIDIRFRADFYGFLSGGTAVLTYGERIQDKADRLRQYFEESRSLETFRDVLLREMGIELQHEYAYYFDRLPTGVDTSQVKNLYVDDVSAFGEFMQVLNPEMSARNKIYMVDYFLHEMVDAPHRAFGIYVDDELVSVANTVTVPHVTEEVAVEVDVVTVPDYRGRGYATMVVVALLQEMVEEERVPIVSCLSTNVASQQLAEKVGFVKFADVISFSLAPKPWLVSGG